MKKITIELTLMEATIVRELQLLPFKLSFPTMYSSIFQYIWLGVLVKHRILALEVMGVDIVSSEEVMTPIIEVYYREMNKSDLI